MAGEKYCVTLYRELINWSLIQYPGEIINKTIHPKTQYYEATIFPICDFSFDYWCFFSAAPEDELSSCDKKQHRTIGI